MLTGNIISDAYYSILLPKCKYVLNIQNTCHYMVWNQTSRTHCHQLQPKSTSKDQSQL